MWKWGRGRKRERSNRKRKGGQKEGKEKKQVYLPLALQADQVSVAPCWVVPQNLARLFSNRSSSSFSPSPRMAAINTHRVHSIEKTCRKWQRPKPQHMEGKERGSEERREMRGGKERGGAREAHRRACFIKVQVQDLSDCQVALSFWFHINVVSFLPPLSSPAPLHSSPRSAVCSFSNAPHSPRLYRKQRWNKVWQKLSALQRCFSSSYLKFWMEMANKLAVKRQQCAFQKMMHWWGQRCTHLLTRCHSFLVSQLKRVLWHYE